MSSNNVVAITMGDPAGVGPEIIAKSFADRESNVPAIVVGDAAMLRRAVGLLDLDLEVHEINDPGDAKLEDGVMDVVGAGEVPDDLPFGELSATAGRAAYDYVEKAIELASAGKVAAVCTAPLNKEALHMAGLKYPGHTEILAGLTDTKDYAMMLVAPDLRVIHVSTHVSLRDAIDRATPERELTVIRLADETMKRIGIAEPRIAVAGLNPHAGENGLFGDDEKERIVPAIEEASGEGVSVSGPWSADTVFLKARNGDFDIVVVQYHDQGHIPIKLLGFESGVNVTVGLPFFRTSVDHGTAFDIAGTGNADHQSLLAALELARDLAAEE